MPRKVHHHVVVFAPLILIAQAGHLPVRIFSTSDKRTDGVGYPNSNGVEFKPFSEDYTLLLTPMQLTAAG